MVKPIFLAPKYLDGEKLSYRYIINKFKARKAMNGLPTNTLGEIARDISDGTRAKRDYIPNGVKIIGPTDIKNGIIYFHKLKSISRRGLQEKDFIREGDILVSGVGRAGQVTIVPGELDGYAISNDVIKIRLKNKMQGPQVAAFLAGPLGQLQLESIKTGTINRIRVQDLSNIMVPRDIKNQNQSYEPLPDQARAYKLYQDCLQLFAQMVPNIPSTNRLRKNWFVNPKLLKADRLDPGYYHYYISGLKELVTKNYGSVKWVRLGEVVEIKRAIKPDLSPDQTVKYFQLSDIDAELSIIQLCSEGKFGQLSNRIRYIVGEGDLVTEKAGSATGTRGHITAVVTEKYAGMLATDAFFNLEPRKIDPYYLLFLFKQPVVLRQIEMFARGLYNKMVLAGDFARLKIPRLGLQAEQKIADNMREYVNTFEVIAGPGRWQSAGKDL